MLDLENLQHQMECLRFKELLPRAKNYQLSS